LQSKGEREVEGLRNGENIWADMRTNVEQISRFEVEGGKEDRELGTERSVVSEYGYGQVLECRIPRDIEGRRQPEKGRS